MKFSSLIYQVKKNIKKKFAKRKKKRLGNDFLLGCLAAYQSEKSFLNVVQVGANDGVSNDPIREFVAENKAKIKILLIEPQPDVVERLKANYSDIPGAEIINKAVGPGGCITLHRIKPEHDVHYRGIIASGITSFRKDYVIEKARRQIPRWVGEAESLIESFEVKCVRLDDVFDRYFKNQVDILQVDTEGFDDEVIYTLNFEKSSPKLINYESVHLPLHKKQGLHGFLRARGYKIYQHGDEDELAILQQK